MSILSYFRRRRQLRELVSRTDSLRKSGICLGDYVMHRDPSILWEYFMSGPRRVVSFGEGGNVVYLENVTGVGVYLNLLRKATDEELRKFNIRPHKL